MRIRAFLFLLFLTGVSACSKEDKFASTDDTYIYSSHHLLSQNEWGLVKTILEVMNDHRKQKRLPILILDSLLASECALTHTQFMIETNKLSHANFERRSELLRESGASSVAENLAYGYQTAEAVVHAWLHSPEHKDIIEGPYTHSGIGILRNEEGRYYYTQLFYK